MGRIKRRTSNTTVMHRKIILVLTVFAVGLTFFQASPNAQAANAPAAVCNPDCVITMPYAGDYYVWTVPTVITSITVDAYGAQGGKSSCTYNTVASGGLGGRVQAKLTTTPGEVLYIFVGGQGSSASISSNTSSPGWNGGGKGGYGNGGGYWGSGGGGATDIRTSVSDTSTRILVAGAGGGSACQNNTTSDNGGAGGGLVGGVSGQAASGSTTSLGGTQSAGGAGITWSGWGPSKAGSLGQGGDAQLTDVSSGGSYVNGGGGGGGGYYGGGGGSWVGGGGGSSYTSPLRASLVTHTQGARTGNGLATISYAIPVPVLTTSIAGNVNSVRKGETIQLTTNVDQAGKVTFLANGKRIAGCIGITTSGGIVTCNWKPTLQGAVKVTAAIYQNGVLKSTSPVLTLGAQRRVGTR
jgi:hypothetical protein